MNENESELKDRVQHLSRQVRRLRHVVIGGFVFLIAFALPVLSVATPRALLLDGIIFGLFALALYPIAAAVWSRLTQPRPNHES